MSTPYSFYTKEELLDRCADARHQSPLIQELCLRLEELNDVGCFSNKTVCPACEAEITVLADATGSQPYIILL